MGERVSTFDALVEAAAEKLHKENGCPWPDNPEHCFAHYVGLVMHGVEALAALVSEGGGTLTETECEGCGGRGTWHGVRSSDDPCEDCKGSGRQWQIGNLEAENVGVPGSTFKLRRMYRFVPSSEGEETAPLHERCQHCITSTRQYQKATGDPEAVATCVAHSICLDPDEGDET